MTQTLSAADWWRVPSAALAAMLHVQELHIPVNYDHSLRDAFLALSQARPGRVLDVGCGSGRALLHARPWLEAGGSMTCIDAHPVALRLTEARAQRMGLSSRVSLRQADIRALASSELPTFDGALAHFSIYMIASDADRRLALQQIATRLEPGARFVFAGPSERYSIENILADADRLDQAQQGPAWRKFLRRRFVRPLIERRLRSFERRLDAGVLHRYSAEEIEAHLREAGFEDIAVESTYGGCGYRATCIRA